MLHAQSALLQQQADSIRLLKGHLRAQPCGSSPTSPLMSALAREDKRALADLMVAAAGDRRTVGLFDARFHSTAR